jgi:hypothetical protein
VVAMDREDRSRHLGQLGPPVPVAERAHYAGEVRWDRAGRHAPGSPGARVRTEPRSRQGTTNRSTTRARSRNAGVAPPSRPARASS